MWEGPWAVFTGKRPLHHRRQQAVALLEEFVADAIDAMDASSWQGWWCSVRGQELPSCQRRCRLAKFAVGFTRRGPQMKPGIN
jgi:hypothetical protein